MKILAIRGYNLASLDGNFVVDLTVPPLDRAGLFAIVGPTGAGKSTLLDALCLALFNRIPRLPGSGGVRVGREGDPPHDQSREPLSHDVRTVLRRGCAEGMAEVDFLGSDGSAYRARWSVRRARLRRDGPMQQAEMVLKRIDADNTEQVYYGGKRQDVLTAIESTLGLTFEQFRRSVLLAQGEFAAFLKAPANERSEVLERITGTALYSRISEAAYARADHERKQLETLAAVRTTLKPLNAPERVALEQAVVAAQAAEETCAQRLAALETAAGWYQRLTELEQAASAATQAAAIADAACVAAAERRATLVRIQQVQPLRGRLEACDAAQKAAMETVVLVEKADADAIAARHTLSDNTAAADRARQAFQESLSRERAAHPLLERAAALDHQRTTLAEEQAVAEAEEQRADRMHTAATAAHTRHRQALAIIDAIIAKSRAWQQTQGPHLPRLAAEWQRWRQALQRAETLGNELDSAQREAEKLRTAQATVATEIAVLRQTCHNTQAVLRNCEAVVAELRTTPLPELTVLHEERRRLDAWKATLEQGRSLATESLRLETTAERLRAESDLLTQEYDTAITAQAAAASTLTELKVRLDEAERALRRITLARETATSELRARLEDGQPCPVCGAHEHPWRDPQQVAVLDQEATERLARVDELRQQQQRTLQIQEQQQAKATQAQKAGATQAQVRADILAEHQRVLARWHTLRAAAGPAFAALCPGATSSMTSAAASLLPLPDAVTLTALTQHSAETEASLARIQEQENAATRLRTHLDMALEQRDQAAAAATAATHQTRDWEAQSAELARTVSHAEATMARAASDLADVIAELSPACADQLDWEAAIRSDARAFSTRCVARVADWHDQQQALDQAQQQQRTLQADDSRLEAERTAAAEALTQAKQRADNRRMQWQAVNSERSALFNGATVAAERERLRAACTAADSILQAVEQAREAAGQSLAAAEQECRGRAETRDQAQKQAEATRAILTTALVELGLSEADLRTDLAHSADWRATEDALLRTLDQNAQTAHTVAQERQRQIRDHYTTATPPPWSREEVTALSRTQQADSTAMRERLTALRLDLRRDDDIRRQHLEQEDGYQKQRAVCQLWDSLNTLVGSRNGAKLRNFAQGLSFERLLWHANRHLAELSRRYWLERAPGSDLELQVVDRDMGDEIRSVHSLSGGETFLVSLALALGLSAMTGGGNRIGTLFIDEGFGALDPHSLDMALSSLEALQATGRQVGLISHVPALVERLAVQVQVEAQGGGRSRVMVWPIG